MPERADSDRRASRARPDLPLTPPRPDDLQSMRIRHHGCTLCDVQPEVHSVPVTTHGRVLVRRARSQPARGVLAGFHGYSETAAIQLTRLEGIPGADAWTLVSVQALHRFYRGRTQEVGASWMTREDRDAAIADNLAYVTAALRVVPDDTDARVIYVGFSQGVAMAFRAALLGSAPAAGVI